MSRAKSASSDWSALLQAPPSAWRGELDYLVARHANHLDRWQFGDDNDAAEFVQNPAMRKRVRPALQRIRQDGGEARSGHALAGVVRHERQSAGNGGAVGSAGCAALANPAVYPGHPRPRGAQSVPEPATARPALRPASANPRPGPARGLRPGRRSEPNRSAAAVHRPQGPRPRHSPAAGIAADHAHAVDAAFRRDLPRTNSQRQQRQCLSLRSRWTGIDGHLEQRPGRGRQETRPEPRRSSPANRPVGQRHADRSARTRPTT